MGFLGTSVHIINDNGRISVPSKIRDVLNREYSDESMVLTLNRDRGCLVVFPAQEWKKKENDLMNPQTRTDAIKARQITNNSEIVSIDKQGRILISLALRAKAGLSGECVIAGLSNRFEIWDKNRWDAEIETEIPDDDSEGLGGQFNQLSF
ncbi:MAG: division/cell wall cluster transcriptional repressor MraZ [Deferribacteraceae bacterium]|jgi:MraZ protein|nr:division/cell wall cluster transcriptional repressor MraZ [Deferribacteraceae bacterium]